MAFFHLNPDGYFYFKDYHHKHITESPIGILVHNLTAYRPLSASVKDSVAEVNYPCGVCRIEISELTDYVKLKLLSVPEGSDGFIFGPYETDAISAGEIIGAAWQEDKTVVCIQSLMPKVVEGASVPYSENQSGTELSKRERAAVLYDGKVSLQLSAVDMSRETKLPDGFVVRPVSDSDASIVGAAVALMSGENAKELLEKIGKMEQAEGLPHPLYRGNTPRYHLRHLHAVYEG